jgi:hypothetical protein
VINLFLSHLIAEAKSILLNRWNANVAKVDVQPDPIARTLNVTLFVYDLRIPEDKRTLLQREIPILGSVAVKVEKYEEEKGEA